MWDVVFVFYFMHVKRKGILNSFLYLCEMMFHFTKKISKVEKWKTFVHQFKQTDLHWRSLLITNFIQCFSILQSHKFK